MTTKTYRGSCHCGAVRFEADIDLAAGVSKCNCSFCTKIRSWGALVKPEAFRLLAGEPDLTDYRFGTMQGHHVFCSHCGIHAFSRGDIPEIGGAFVSVQLASLDDLAPAELIAAPLHISNGRDNDWMNPPAETGTSETRPGRQAASSDPIRRTVFQLRNVPAPPARAGVMAPESRDAAIPFGRCTQMSPPTTATRSPSAQ